jgi:glycine cleavage system H lipoate-binding protein
MGSPQAQRHRERAQGQTLMSHIEALVDTPGVINGDPYGEGWLFEFEVDRSVLAEQIAALMDDEAYGRLIGESTP